MNTKPYERKPHFYETDQMGIIHHANYIRWFEEARVDFMEQIGYGYDKASHQGIDFAVLSVSCDYKSMIRFGDTVLIHAHITDLTPTRMTVEYSITDAKTGQLRTTGNSKHCYIDTKRSRPVSLKKTLPALYALFEQTVLNTD